MKFVLMAALVLPLACPTHGTSAPGINRSYMNPAVSPVKDFYNYANGAFDRVPIPGDYSTWGVNEEINERTFAVLKSILETSAKTRGPNGSIAQRVGDFYAAGMNEAAVEQAGIKPLLPWFSEIDKIATPDELVEIIGHLQATGLEAGFGFGVQVDDKDATATIASFTQGGLGLPERDYYFRTGQDSEDIRRSYVAHIARMLELTGTEGKEAKAQADAIMALETKLARVSRTLVDLRDPEKNYHKYQRSTLVKLAPDFPWEDFLTQVHFPPTEKTLLVGQPEFFSAFAQLLRAEPLQTWRSYLRWHVLNQLAGYLNQALVDETFAFYGRTLSGETEQKPRWKRVMTAADNAIGEDLGQLYVRTSFSPAAKERAVAMVKFHLEAMRNRIRAAAWMSEPTKIQAYKKIDAMRYKVGYPDHWRDYAELNITRDSYVANAIAASAFEMHRQLAKLGKPVDRTEWLMTPQTNNAYYEPTLNEMCFPAGILQPPFFNENADDASNYGALASTIGHELTHGFDDQGRQYDAAGNLKNWWTGEDAKRFSARADLVAKQYDAFEVLPGLHINGQQTLGENIADIGGLRVSYEAFKLATAGKKLTSIDGFTPDQRFFIAFAQSWRTNERPEQLRLQIASDLHSPARWRVLGPVANFPEFRDAFGDTDPASSWPPIW
ncbi:MAG: M13 family metallopeptidase [Lacunisphaera sp.]